MTQLTPFPTGDKAEALYVACRRVAIFEFLTLDGREQFQGFRDHYMGTGAQRADWLRVWRGWLRKPYQTRIAALGDFEFESVDIGEDAIEEESRLVDIFYERSKMENAR